MACMMTSSARRQHNVENNCIIYLESIYDYHCWLWEEMRPEFPQLEWYILPKALLAAPWVQNEVANINALRWS